MTRSAWPDDPFAEEDEAPIPSRSSYTSWAANPFATLPLDATAHVFGQAGLITRQQAMAAGMSRATLDGLVRRKRWRRVLPTVYLARPVEFDTERRIRAVQLWAGPTSVIAGEAALFWQGRNSERLRVVEVAVSPDRRLDEPAGVKIRRPRLCREDVRLQKGVRVLTVARAVVDLLAIAGAPLLDEVLQRRWATIDEINAACERCGPVKGATARNAIVRAAATGGHSEGERELHRNLRRAGITGWTANAPVMLNGVLRFADVAFEAIKLAIEVDGFAFHSDQRTFQRDRERQNHFVIDGWTVLRFTWWQLVNEPDAVIAQIRQAIDRLSRQGV